VAWGQHHEKPAVDLKDRTGVEGSSHLAQRSTIPSKSFLQSEDTRILLLYIVQYCINTVYFYPLQVENKPLDRDMNVHLFLSLHTRMVANRCNV
jgi:hypothetical protein